MLPTAHAQIQPTPVLPARLHIVTSLFTPMRRVHGGHRKARACPGHRPGGHRFFTSIFLSPSPKVSPPGNTLHPPAPSGTSGPSLPSEGQPEFGSPGMGREAGGAVIALGGASTRPDPDARLPHTWCPGQRFAHPPTQGSFLESPFHLSRQPQLDGRKARTPGLKFQPCPLVRAV